MVGRIHHGTRIDKYRKTEVTKKGTMVNKIVGETKDNRDLHNSKGEFICC